MNGSSPSDEMSHGSELVLLTGTTGYVGGRLLSRLEQRGVRVRCLSRRPEALSGRVGSTTETVAGDVLDPDVPCRRRCGASARPTTFVHSLGAVRDSRKRIGGPRRTSLTPLASRAFVGSSTWEGSVIPTKHFPSTCATVRKRAICCGNTTRRSLSSGPRS